MGSSFRIANEIVVTLLNYHKNDNKTQSNIIHHKPLNIIPKKKGHINESYTIWQNLLKNNWKLRLRWSESSL